MNHPVEEAASHAASHVNKVGLAVSWAGNGLAWLTLHQAELQTIILLLTGAYTLWQFGRDVIRDKIRDSREKMAHRKLLAKINAMQTAPGGLSPERAYAMRPTPLWDDTYSGGHDNGAGR